jgi:hypothetical protein
MRSLGGLVYKETPQIHWVRARTTDLTDEVPYCEAAQVTLRPVMNTIYIQGQHGLPRT